jgi:hypothetical protein
VGKQVLGLAAPVITLLSRHLEQQETHDSMTTSQRATSMTQHSITQHDMKPQGAAQ